MSLLLPALAAVGGLLFVAIYADFILSSNKYNVRRKKEVIPIKDIINIASADIKRRFVKKKMFAIRFKDAHEVKTLQLNHTVYFMKELQRLFDHLERKYGITYIQF